MRSFSIFIFFTVGLILRAAEPAGILPTIPSELRLELSELQTRLVMAERDHARAQVASFQAVFTAQDLEQKLTATMERVKAACGDQAEIKPDATGRLQCVALIKPVLPKPKTPKSE